MEKKTAEEVATLWIDGLTPCSTTNALNKLRLASDLVEFSNQQLADYKSKLKEAIILKCVDLEIYYGDRERITDLIDSIT
jgi:hypothetical protein